MEKPLGTSRLKNGSHSCNDNESTAASWPFLLCLGEAANGHDLGNRLVPRVVCRNMCINWMKKSMIIYMCIN
jgi:hypothetical protein